MKAESSFSQTVVSKAGAVGLMQLIPETAIRHGVRNLHDTNGNITGGAKHLRHLLDRFHGNIRLALAVNNAGERKVALYDDGQITPYKETQDYVKKVLVHYRGYKKDGWIMSAVMTTPSVQAGRSYSMSIYDLAWLSGSIGLDEGLTEEAQVSILCRNYK